MQLSEITARSVFRVYATGIAIVAVLYGMATIFANGYCTALGYYTGVPTWDGVVCVDRADPRRPRPRWPFVGDTSVL